MAYRIQCTYANARGTKRKLYEQYGVVYSTDSASEAAFVAQDVERQHNSDSAKDTYCRAFVIDY